MADKLIVAAALLMVTHMYSSAIIAIPAIIILMREIYVSALRELMSQQGRSNDVKVNIIGKAKTMTQMLALIGLLSGLDVFMGFPIYWVFLGKVLLWIAAILSVWSMIVYSSAAWKTLKTFK